MWRLIKMKFDNLIMIVIFLGVVAFGGILAGLIYYDMNILDTVLHTVNFEFPTYVVNGSNYSNYNGNLSDFQDVLTIVVYPILGLKDSLPYLTYFMVFAFIIALGMTAYLSSKNPIFFVVHLLFTFLMTYFCFILSNTYTTLLQDPFINAMMIGFPIYNKLMLFLPQIVFFTSLLFGAISFINIMKPQREDVGGTLNYGGDY
jgi:hypothetical protein